MDKNRELPPAHAEVCFQHSSKKSANITTILRISTITPTPQQNLMFQVSRILYDFMHLESLCTWQTINVTTQCTLHKILLNMLPRDLRCGKEPNWKQICIAKLCFNFSRSCFGTRNSSTNSPENWSQNSKDQSDQFLPPGKTTSWAWNFPFFVWRYIVPQLFCSLNMKGWT